MYFYHVIKYVLTLILLVGCLIYNNLLDLQIKRYKLHICKNMMSPMKNIKIREINNIETNQSQKYDMFLRNCMKYNFIFNSTSFIHLYVIYRYTIDILIAPKICLSRSQIPCTC